MATGSKKARNNTFTWWVAPSSNDSACYSAVGRTQEECEANKLEGAAYDETEKRIVHYSDLFDLFEHLTNEGGGRVTSGYSDPLTKKDKT